MTAKTKHTPDALDALLKILWHSERDGSPDLPHGDRMMALMHAREALSQRGELLVALKRRDALLVCYRVGKRPTEKLLDDIAADNAAISKAEGDPNA